LRKKIMTNNIYIDFETRSEVDIKKVGAWQYSVHPSTEILCAGIKIDEWGTGTCPPQASYMSQDHSNSQFYAHNALFEYLMWNNCGVKKYDWPETRLDQWYCSAAIAAYHSLPRSLEGACMALGLATQKDMAGHRLMLKMCKPRKPTKNNDAKWHETAEDLERLGQYCIKDVDAMYELVQALGPLPQAERDLWLLTQRINLRGVGVDPETVKSALMITAKAQKVANAQIKYYTDGLVSTTGQVAKIFTFCVENGVELPDCSAATIDQALQLPELDPTVREVLSIRRRASKSSLKKLQAIEHRFALDGRVRDMLLYYGAGTGRWAGMGVQPQNLPRCTFEPADLDHIHRLIQAGNIKGLALMYGPELDVISQALRSTLCAAPGNVLVGADYSSIEARVLLWLARDPGLKVFETGDIYCDMAAAIFGRPVSQITKAQRQLGKVAILGLGYGMGASKFKQTCHNWGIEIDEVMAQDVIETYRAKYSAVKQYWRNIEEGAKATIHGSVISNMWLDGDFFKIRLSSGRDLHYYKPKLVPDTTPWGAPTTKVTYVSVNGVTRKWERTETWGGKLVENITQALARDVMAEAMLQLEGQNKDIVLSVHDELVIEVDERYVENAKYELKSAMTHVPKWAAGLPLATDEPWVNRRYVK
jgi:DNA polymerase